MTSDSPRHLFFDAHPEPMWIYDIETLRFLVVNAAAIDKYGYSREEFLAMTLADIRPPEDVAALEDNIAAVTEGLDKAGIWRHRLKSGETVDVEITSHTVEHEGRRAEVVLARDATRIAELERAQAAHERQREQDAHLRTAQRLLGLGFWRFEFSTERLTWSDEVYVMYGVPHGGFDETFEAYVELVHPGDREQMRLAFDAFIEAGQSHFYFEHRIVRPAGGVIHVRGAGEIDEREEGRILAGVVEDITERKEAEIAVRESEEQLRIAGHAARLGAWRVTLDPHEFIPREVIWSDETAAIHGLPPGTQPTFEDAIRYCAPEYRQRITNLFEACARDGTPFDEVLELARPDGERLWVRSIGEPERARDGRIVSVRGAFQDISDLVAARQEARELDLRLRDTLESISDGFFTLDRDWSFVFLNSQAEHLLSRRRAELIGRSIWHEFPDLAGSTFEHEFHRAMTRSETVSFIGFFAPLESWFDVSAYPTENGLAVYFRDITERRRVEDAARVNEERFQIVAKATNDVIWDWDLVAGTVWWNENFSELSGYDPVEVEPGPESWSNRIHPDDRDAVLESIHEVIDGGGATWEREYRFMHANGAAVIVIDRGYVIRDADGTARRMVGSMMDVTERRELDERLKQSQKLEAIGQLTGGIAHDFNNLLTVILGNADALREQLGDRRELHSLAEMAAEAASRGADLTNRLLAFGRRQALAPRVVDINRLVAGMDGLLRRTLTAEIEIEFVRAGGLWQIEVDPGQLESALLNLAINARDAMPSGGRLTIETANASLDEDYASRHDGVVAGQYVVVAVTDTGTGMPEDTVARAFDPFFTTKATGEGSGLGLSMVYGFVKQSGGHAKIYTEPGEGTAVKLYFPRVQQHDAAQQSTDEPQAAAAGGREHILVVEDEELVRQYVERQLESLGYAVSSVGSGPEALELLERRGAVDLLFTDVVMPAGMNGRELAEAARLRYPELRVLFTSGYTENAIVHHGRLDRGVELLSKPYRRRDLAAKLRKVLDAPAT